MVTELYDHEDIYGDEISPLIKQIIDICNTYKIPMICSFTYQKINKKWIGHCDTILNSYETRIV